MYCVWNCSQGRELTYFANTSTLSNYGKRWVKFLVSNNTIEKYFFSKKWRNAIKKENFPSQQNCLPFLYLFPFTLQVQMFFRSYNKKSCMYKNRGMISVCNKQCGDDDWPDKKSRHGYIWPWIDI